MQADAAMRIARVLSEALPYIQRYTGKTIVIGGLVPSVKQVAGPCQIHPPLSKEAAVPEPTLSGFSRMQVASDWQILARIRLWSDKREPARRYRSFRRTPLIRTARLSQ